ncbi:MAG: hypothetical protein ABUM51_06365 [Bacteroidota bacterium]
MAAKVQLSKEERTLVMDPGWILTKNSIMGKVGALFAELSGRMQEGGLPLLDGLLRADDGSSWVADGSLKVDDGLPPNWSTPKISRGENYKGLPWVVLDYPRAFGKEDVLAIRTLFWWGHYFSVTLHLKGKYKDLFLPVIRQHLIILEQAGFYVGTSDDEWRHELDSDNYQPLQAGMDTTILEERTFLKLSAKCGLDRWDEADSVLLELYRILMGVING